jgi:hypothetical protein
MTAPLERYSNVLRFLVTALMAAGAAIVVATLSLPVVTLLGSPAINMAGKGDGLAANIVGAIVTLPLAILIGGVIAFPATLIMGGVMVWLTRRAPHLDSVWLWIGAAILGGIPPMFIVGSAYEMVPDRIIIGAWLELAALVGALVFRWRWRRGR